MTRLRRLVTEKLGRCPRCMRLSLAGASVGWIVFCAVELASPGSFLAHLALAGALPFSILWVVHIATFGIRLVVAVQTAPSSVGDSRATPGQSDSRAERRHFLGLFIKGATIAILASLA